MKTICLSLLVLAGAVVGASGQSSRSDINPALLYYQAFLVAPDPMPEADMDYMASRAGRSQKLPERFGKTFAGYDNQFKLLRQAAHAAVPCDWGIDMSEGPAALLPHLARCKAVAQATRLRTLWQLQQNHQAEACDDLLAAFTLARNVSRDGTIISTLTQQASEAINCATVAEYFGQFSPEIFQRLVQGLEAAPARGTVAASVPKEKAFFHDWTVRKIMELRQQHPGDDAKVMAGIHQFLGTESPEESETNLWERLTQAAGGTSDGLLKLLQEREQLYERLALFLALPYPEFQSQVKEFRAALETSPNPFIAMTLPGFLRARTREFKIQVWLAMLHAAMEYKLHGETGVQSIPDPCGQGPFTYQRFILEGADRGFSLKSAYTGSGFQEVLIFVEKGGPIFRVDGPFAGQARP
ncbi:MAG TPA: hypothetical protein VNZ22_07170 [Bacillota bacterium]|nr:hypothetical protein [Bacillota bacterium]